MVNQVTVIGILMIVNGSLCTLYGMLLAFMGPFLSSWFNFQAGQAPVQGQPQMQQMQQMMNVVSIVYVVLGSMVAIAGVMNIAGGIAALRFRSRSLVITALFFNIVPLFTCYCLPTSLGLMIWGLVVIFQADVSHAFTLGSSGYSADEIKQRMGFGMYRRDDYRRDDWDERNDGGDEARPPKPPPKGEPGEEHIHGGEEPPPKPPPKTGPAEDQFFEK